jgi:hypothetical protein
MENENVTDVTARCALALGRAWHHPQVRQSDSNWAPELSCVWQLCAMRMQQAGRAGAEAAAAKAVAIGQQSASTINTALARTDWRWPPVMGS